jgi:hypothetical protein
VTWYEDTIQATPALAPGCRCEFHSPYLFAKKNFVKLTLPTIASTEQLIIHFATRIVSIFSICRSKREYLYGADFLTIDAEQLKQWSDVLGLTAKADKINTPQSGYTQTIYGNGSAATAQLVGYSAQGVGHTVPQHPDMDIAFFGI